MKKKADAWAIVRADGSATNHLDDISVKGVYDCVDDAQAELVRLGALAPGETRYHLLKTRRYSADIEHSHPTAQTDTRVQGFPRVHGESAASANRHADETRALLQELAQALPVDVRRRTLAPILGRIAESAVAAALNGHVVQHRQARYDVVLDDGTRVEVKSVTLDPNARRAPHLEVPEPPPFDKLALVVFGPDLTLHTARLFPVEALARYGRHEERGRGPEATSSFRVSPAFLAAPEASDIFAPGEDIWAKSLPQSA